MHTRCTHKNVQTNPDDLKTMPLAFFRWNKHFHRIFHRITTNSEVKKHRAMYTRYASASHYVHALYGHMTSEVSDSEKKNRKRYKFQLNVKTLCSEVKQLHFNTWRIQGNHKNSSNSGILCIPCDKNFGEVWSLNWNFYPLAYPFICM